MKWIDCPRSRDYICDGCGRDGIDTVEATPAGESEPGAYCQRCYPAAMAGCGASGGDELHHADGSHRTTPASTSGRVLERHEIALREHLAAIGA